MTTTDIKALAQIPADLLADMQAATYTKGQAVRFSPNPIGRLVTGTYVGRTARGHKVNWCGTPLEVTYVIPVL